MDNKEFRAVFRPYAKSDYGVFREMFKKYFINDFKISLTEKQADERCGKISEQTLSGIEFLDLLIIGGVPKGFIIYQVDAPESDWCKREGWGLIRETYIARDERGKGYGRDLAIRAEEKLWSLSVPNIYLTSDDAVDFWAKLGYRNTNEIETNGNYILIK